MNYIICTSHGLYAGVVATGRHFFTHDVKTARQYLTKEAALALSKALVKLGIVSHAVVYQSIEE
jgi:hypothetical protein